ncbi:armadillo-type protein [Panaeolus papilionaceus]|nr:armadillo-type protein [Panaeolus papilionaceus]
MAAVPHPDNSARLPDIGNCVYCSQVVSDNEEAILKEISEFASFDGFSDTTASLISKRLELIVNNAVQHGIEIGKKAQQTRDTEDVERHRTAYLSVRDQLAQALKPKDGTQQLQDGSFDRNKVEGPQVKSFGITPPSLGFRSNLTTLSSLSPPWIRRTHVRVSNRFFNSECLRIKFLLNQLTMANFDNISNLIITRINNVYATQDDRTFAFVVHHIYRSAVNGTKYTEVYTRLCRNVMERINVQIKADNTMNKQGGLVPGAQLFRKHLVNKFQDDFEPRTLDNTSIRSDDRQYLGVAKFVGELYRVQMLTERIVHQCLWVLAKSLDDLKGLDYLGIEALCILLSSAGEALDTPKARAHMDVYYSRMSAIVSVATPHALPNRLRFMVLSIIELRKSNWVPRRAATAQLGPLSTNNTGQKTSGRNGRRRHLKSEGRMDGRA